jgi:serine/threonine protein kinase
MEYMAPEIIRGTADPSTQTDLHSLAVLLFYLWVWHHPFHGEMEYRFHCWDIPAKKKVYGETPVFVFDPDDASNRLPQDPDYAIAKERWAYCPEELRDTFTRAFTEGLRDPDRRVTEGEWQGLFSRIKDRIAGCPRCKAENFAGPDGHVPPCWHCHTGIIPPPVLSIRRTSGNIPLLLSLGTTLRKRHISSATPMDDGAEVVGKVVPHPSIAGAAGIRNLSKDPWQITFPDGRITDVPPDRAVPLHPGTTIRIEGIELVILATEPGVTP